MRPTTLVAALATTAALTLGLVSAPASADHNRPAVTVNVPPGDCGETTFNTSWPDTDHQVPNTSLVVQVEGEQYVAPVGESLVVGPFDVEAVEIRWRVAGGGERAYDSPEWDVTLDELLAYIGEHSSGFNDLTDLPTEQPDFVGWYAFEVPGCAPQPPPTTTTTEDPTTTTAEDESTTTTESPTTSSTGPDPATQPAEDFEYANCDEAPANIEPGDYGWGEHLDSDGDGVGCDAERSGGRLPDTGSSNRLVPLALGGGALLVVGALVGLSKRYLV